MMLRWIVSNWLRQMAQHQSLDSLAQAARGGATQGASLQGGGSQPTEPAACRILLAFALGVEAGGTVDLLRDTSILQGPTFLEHNGWLDQQRVAVIETGVGSSAACQATRDAIAVHRPQWVVSAGFAGALTPQLKRGHLLMASQLVDTDGTVLDVGLQFDRQSLEANPSVHTGRLLTVDRLICSADEKRQLGQQHDAVACDMESSSVAQVCADEKVRFLSVRVISDAVDDELPQEIERLLEQKSLAAKLGAATGAILGRPSSVKEMWKLKEDALRASDRLAKFLLGVLPPLSEQGPQSPGSA